MHGWGLVVGIAVGLLACGDKTEGPQPTSSSAGHIPAPTAGTGSGKTSPQDAPVPKSAHAGVWKGAFKSERGDVTVPEGVAYKSWKEDPGGFEGDNTIEITVGDDGVAKGRIEGALGRLIIVGLVEDETFRVGLSPENATDPAGMTGVLTGKLEGPEVTAELRVSSADASVVRKAKVSLSRP